MARILYHSTHEPLEYDDIKLFTELGHTVFSTGMYCPANQQQSNYRPSINYGEDVLDLLTLFRKENCACVFMDPTNTNLSARFINQFDYIISVQDLGLVLKYWDVISGPVVVWRTVGQSIDHADEIALPLRTKGLKIVRWSDREQFAQVYAGHDAVIRAYKDPDEYAGWTGENNKVVTFSNSYSQRYPIEYGLFERVCYLLDYSVGGVGNEGIKNALGPLDYEAMKSELRGAGVYFYMHGSYVPYTLNFIEAWMTGIPVVAPARNVEIHALDIRYNEINDLILDKSNGFLFTSEIQAKGIIMNLLLDRAYASHIGSKGREMAIRIFGKKRAMADWTAFFNAFPPRSMASTHNFAVQTVDLTYGDWGLYNNPEVNERKAELPIAFWFLKSFRQNSIEIGEVTPFYAKPLHTVYDAAPEKPETIIRDAIDMDFLGKNVLSISTLEHVGSGDYGLPIEHHKAIAVIKNIVHNAKTWLITFAVGSNPELERDLIESGIAFFLLERKLDNTWQQVDHHDIGIYKYGDPLPHGNGVIVITNLCVKFNFNYA